MNEKVDFMFKGIDLSSVMDLLQNRDISGWFKNNEGGDALRSFQKCFAEYCGTKHAFAVSSGSAAIYVALKACGIKRNNSVIVPAYTHIGTVAPIVLAGAKPLFTDVDIHGNLAPDLLQDSDLAQADALIAVHQLGMPCDMYSVKKRFSGFIIEDAAHALGSRYKGRNIGTLGDIACFSIGGGRTKTIACGEGGMVTVNNDDLAEKCKNIRNHGDRVTDCNYFCFNFRMSELNALVGLLQMPRLDAANEWQIRHAEYLIEHMPHYIQVPAMPAHVKTTRYIVSGRWSPTLTRSMERNKFLRIMSARGWDGGIPRMNIGGGYSKLVYDIKFYRRYFKKRLPISEKLLDEAIWIDWHRYPRTDLEIDTLLNHMKEVCPA